MKLQHYQHIRQYCNLPRQQLFRFSYRTMPYIRLIKKNLSKKMGLQSLLGIGSDVRDSYRLLETVQSSFKVSWQTVKRPQDLGDPPLSEGLAEVTLSTTGIFKHSFPLRTPRRLYQYFFAVVELV